MESVLPGKRKRPVGVAAATTLPGNGQTSSSQPARSGTAQHQQHGISSLLPNPPRLDAIPDMVEELAGVIRSGGCPRCGGTECKRSNTIRHGAVTVQYYSCKECFMNFHFHELLKEKNGSNNGNHPYRDRTFEGKQKLQALVRHAYGEIVKQDMEKDRLEFEQRIRMLQHQLKEKRRKISRLLGIPLHDGSENTTEQASNNFVDNGYTKQHASNGEREDNRDPFQETILLLRHETPKLEQRVSRQLARHRNHSSPSSPIINIRGSSPTASCVDGQQRQTMMKEEDEKVISIKVGIVKHGPMPETKPDKCYKLASRIIQDGGDEIEIYEKCNVDEHLP